MKLIDYIEKQNRYDITVELDDGQVVSCSVPSLSALDIKLAAQQITKQEVIECINKRLLAIPKNKQLC